jgi:hypothetical protein
MRRILPYLVADLLVVDFLDRLLPFLYIPLILKQGSEFLSVSLHYHLSILLIVLLPFGAYFNLTPFTPVHAGTGRL